MYKHSIVLLVIEWINYKNNNLEGIRLEKIFYSFCKALKLNNDYIKYIFFLYCVFKQNALNILESLKSLLLFIISLD